MLAAYVLFCTTQNKSVAHSELMPETCTFGRGNGGGRWRGGGGRERDRENGATR